MIEMDYDEFCKQIADNVLSYLPERYQDYKVVIQDITTSDGVDHDGLTLIPEGAEEGCAMLFYLDRAYEKDMTAETACQIIAENYLKNEDKLTRSKLDIILDYDSVKDKISSRMYSIKGNEKLIHNSPHHLIGDMACLYHINYSLYDKDDAMIRITNDMMNEWGISVEELHEQAMTGDVTMYKPDLCVFDFDSALYDINLFDAGIKVNQMLLLGNREYELGSNMIVHRDYMDKVRKIVGEDFYIIPTNIHNAVVIPHSYAKRHGMTVNDLGRIARDMYADMKTRNEQLSDRIYSYDGKHRTLVVEEELPTKEKNNRTVGLIH